MLMCMLHEIVSGDRVQVKVKVNCVTRSNGLLWPPGYRGREEIDCHCFEEHILDRGDFLVAELLLLLYNGLCRLPCCRDVVLAMLYTPILMEIRVLLNVLFAPNMIICFGAFVALDDVPVSYV